MDKLIEHFRKGLTIKEEDLEGLYKQASDAYYNSGEPFLTDAEFDALKARLKSANPKNAALAIVGAPVRDTGRKFTLPYWMGSLDKIRDDDKAITKWKTKYPGSVIVSDKLDGNSAMYVRSANGVEGLYSRGDGFVGQDCSNLLKHIQGTVSESGVKKFVVRGEVIMSRKTWDSLEHKGANARNVTAGVMNSKTIDVELAKALEFVAYELLEPKGMTPSEGLKWMQDAGFSVVPHSVWTETNVNMEKLSIELVTRREKSPYEVDGIVVFQDAAGHRVIKGKNPKYGFAFKSVVTHDEAEVIVSDVEWNVSKDGFVKPTVIFEPVSLNGVVIRRATGFNAAFIRANGIGIGARATIIRSGDVIPKITKIIEQAPGGPKMPPDGTWKWQGTVDIVATANDAGAISALEHFVKTMEVEFVGRGTLERLSANGITDIRGLMGLNVTALKAMDGIGPKNAERIAASIAAMKERGLCEKWMVASNMFGRGVGNSKIKAIVEMYPEVVTGKIPENRTLNVEGVGKKTLDGFFEALPTFLALMKDVGVRCVSHKAVKSRSQSPAAVVETNGMKGQVLVFTGFRNKEWEAAVEAKGGIISATISKKTTLVVAKDPTEDSTKLKKARDLGIKVISAAEFRV